MALISENAFSLRAAPQTRSSVSDVACARCIPGAQADCRRAPLCASRGAEEIDAPAHRGLTDRLKQRVHLTLRQKGSSAKRRDYRKEPANIDVCWNQHFVCTLAYLAPYDSRCVRLPLPLPRSANGAD